MDLEAPPPKAWDPSIPPENFNFLNLHCKITQNLPRTPQASLNMRTGPPMENISGSPHVWIPETPSDYRGDTA